MILSITRYDSPGVVPPSAKASSAARTCSASRSGSAYTATLVRPASLHARATRTAISPRLAIRTFCTGVLPLVWTGRTVASAPGGRAAGCGPSALSAAPEVGDRQPALGQLRAQHGKQHPDDGGRVALDPAHERRPEPVEGECPRHGQGLPGGEVGLDLLGGRGGEGDDGGGEGPGGARGRGSRGRRCRG